MFVTQNSGLCKPKQSSRSAGSKKLPCNCMGGRVARCPARASLSSEYKRLKDNQRQRDRSRLRRAAPTDLAARVVRAFVCQCEYCGRKGDTKGFQSRWSAAHYTDFWTVDRIVPGARGGTYDPHNVTLACGTCNGLKQARDYIGPVRSLEIMEALRG